MASKILESNGNTVCKVVQAKGTKLVVWIGGVHGLAWYLLGYN